MMLASHYGVMIQVMSSLLSIQIPANTPEKAEGDASSAAGVEG